MTDAEATEFVKNTNARLVKIQHESEAMVEINQKLQEALDAAIEAGRTITPELEEAIRASDTQAQKVDAVVKDLPEVEPPE